MSAHDALDAMARRHDSDHWHPQSESCDQLDLVAFARAVLDLADEYWKFEDENTGRAEGKAAAAGSIRHLATEHLTNGDDDE